MLQGIYITNLWALYRTKTLSVEDVSIIHSRLKKLELLNRPPEARLKEPQELIRRLSQFKTLNHVWLFVTPMDCSMPGFPVITNSWSLLRLVSIELTMSSNQLVQHCPLLFLPSILSQHQGLFQWVSSLHQVARVLEFQLQHQSSQWIFRTDFL